METDSRYHAEGESHHRGEPEEEQTQPSIPDVGSKVSGGESLFPKLLEEDPFWKPLTRRCSGTLSLDVWESLERLDRLEREGLLAPEGITPETGDHTKHDESEK